MLSDVYWFLCRRFVGDCNCDGESSRWVVEGKKKRMMVGGERVC